MRIPFGAKNCVTTPKPPHRLPTTTHVLALAAYMLLIYRRLASIAPGVQRRRLAYATNTTERRKPRVRVTTSASVACIGILSWPVSCSLDANTSGRPETESVPVRVRSCVGWIFFATDQTVFNLFRIIYRRNNFNFNEINC